jgi:nitrite reductase/ring-hydroxylating ferredoxin subunit
MFHQQTTVPLVKHGKVTLAALLISNPHSQECTMTTEWHDVGASADVSEDMPLTTKLGDKEIGVYRLKGQYYALEDVCPHAYALLSQGFVMNDEIECPLHGARWNICSGKMTAEPGGRDLRCYPCKEENGRVLIQATAT